MEWACSRDEILQNLVGAMKTRKHFENLSICEKKILKLRTSSADRIECFFS